MHQDEKSILHNLTLYQVHQSQEHSASSLNLPQLRASKLVIPSSNILNAKAPLQKHHRDIAKVPKSEEFEEEEVCIGEEEETYAEVRN